MARDNLKQSHSLVRPPGDPFFCPVGPLPSQVGIPWVSQGRQSPWMENGTGTILPITISRVRRAAWFFFYDLIVAISELSCTMMNCFTTSAKHLLNFMAKQNCLDTSCIPFHFYSYFTYTICLSHVTNSTMYLGLLSNVAESNYVECKINCTLVLFPTPFWTSEVMF